MKIRINGTIVGNTIIMDPIVNGSSSNEKIAKEVDSTKRLVIMPETIKTLEELNSNNTSQTSSTSSINSEDTKP